MKAVIVSQQFNNGHIAGILGWYEMFALLNMECAFYMDYQYKEYLDKSGKLFIDNFSDLSKYDLILIFNLSLKDGKLIKKIKKSNHNIKILFLHHEPWRGLKEEKERLMLSPVLGMKILIKKIIAKNIIKNTDCVILPSFNANEIYKKNEAKYNKRYERINLVMTDSSNGKINLDKKYFSFIATASKDKSIDIFIEFIKYCHKKKEEIEFSIITKSDITQYIDSDIEEIIASNKLKIISGSPLSEEKMNEAYDNSLCTWLVYRSSSQSGVLPKCFMWGSPVVASKVGVFCDQVNGSNGILIDSITDFDSIIDAFHVIKEDKNSFIAESRKSYEQIYSVENNAKILERILKNL